MPSVRLCQPYRARLYDFYRNDAEVKMDLPEIQEIAAGAIATATRSR